MNKVNFGQLFLGAAFLAAAFYIGINYENKPADTPMNSVSQLANEDLTLKKPLIDGNAAQPPLAITQKESVKPPLVAPQLATKDSTMPKLEKNLNRDVTKIESSVEPDFSVIERGLRKGDAPKTPAAAVFDEYKPLIPPTNHKESAGLLTPELSQFDPKVAAAKPPVSPRESENMAAISDRNEIANPNRMGAFQIHVIRPGETLQSIAKRYYHTDEYYLEVYVANQDVLQSPIKLPVGTSIKIPDVSRLMVSNESSK